MGFILHFSSLHSYQGIYKYERPICLIYKIHSMMRATTPPNLSTLQGDVRRPRNRRAKWRERIKERRGHMGERATVPGVVEEEKEMSMG
ncbi:hypothetical protein D5086_019369 [Populus alba]|uniref:Uncharacterized protein n=1 Tax=Populus alba TaxID=43335 RepID=A0ACC4BH09_POPAL